MSHLSNNATCSVLAYRRRSTWHTGFRIIREAANSNEQHGTVSAMWASLLVLGLLLTLHPLRLGVTLLVISRPRPMQNLLTYCGGCVTVCIVTLLIPLIMLQFVPTLASFMKNFSNPATNPPPRHIAIGVGVFALSVAALMTVRLAARPRAHLPTCGKHRRIKAGSDHTSTLMLDSDPPNPISRLLTPAQDEESEDGSAFRRLLRRVRNAWENGSLWVAFVIGLGMGPSVDGVLFALAIIVASGPAIGMQVSAAITFTIAMLAVQEIILVSNLATPVKTQAFLRRLRDWSRAHRRKVLIAIFAVVGVSLVAQGMASG